MESSCAPCKPTAELGLGDVDELITAAGMCTLRGALTLAYCDRTTLTFLAYPSVSDSPI
jgi:hypothetical protein